MTRRITPQTTLDNLKKQAKRWLRAWRGRLLDGPFTDAGLAGLVGLDGLFGLSFFWHVSYAP